MLEHDRRMLSFLNCQNAENYTNDAPCTGNVATTSSERSQNKTAIDASSVLLYQTAQQSAVCMCLITCAY